eukprot:TRINITY_DN1918_c0_g1_i1.p1 TRINITY_DN1918_c0_g1~~TRINITY_DN1918_c0_g1_i1.p1  ORF type:complete len:1135 (-),score=295.14 TRINITY_DN1918_c0_g1_i1:58-3462(-)
MSDAPPPPPPPAPVMNEPSAPDKNSEQTKKTREEKSLDSVLQSRKVVSEDDRVLALPSIDSKLRPVATRTAQFVGLSNQGATCYLNSLLQTLFMTPEFRGALYHCTFNESEGETPIAYQLQKLFAFLQLSTRRAVDTRELTHSFGWTAAEVFQQHDIQELCMILFENLEILWTNTQHAGLIRDVYNGQMMNFVECKECGHKNTRNETFLDLQLPIKGIFHINDSLKEYFKSEILNGDNQYNCERCAKKVDAEKGISFLSVGKILSLQLRRFDYHPTTWTRIKLNTFFEFSSEIDIAPYFAEKTETPCVYELFSVLIHSGGALGGHYHAYVKNIYDNKWYDFNDSTVTEISFEEDVCSAFGDISTAPSHIQTPKIAKRPTSANAYMLMYRQKNMPQPPQITKEDIPAPLRATVEADNLAVEKIQAEQERVKNLVYLHVHWADSVFDDADTHAKIASKGAIAGRSLTMQVNRTHTVDSVASAVLSHLLARLPAAPTQSPTISEKEMSGSSSSRVARPPLRIDDPQSRRFFWGSSDSGKSPSSPVSAPAPASPQQKKSATPSLECVRLRAYSVAKNLPGEPLPTRSEKGEEVRLEDLGFLAYGDVFLETRPTPDTPWPVFNPNLVTLFVMLHAPLDPDSPKFGFNGLPHPQGVMNEPIQFSFDLNNTAQELRKYVASLLNFQENELQLLLGSPTSPEHAVSAPGGKYETARLCESETLRHLVVDGSTVYAEKCPTQDYLALLSGFSESGAALVALALSTPRSPNDPLSLMLIEFERVWNHVTVKYNRPGTLEFNQSLVIDQRKTISDLRNQICALTDMRANECVLKRGSILGKEFKDPDALLVDHGFSDGIVVHVERGVPLQWDEHHIDFWVRQPQQHQPEKENEKEKEQQPQDKQKENADATTAGAGEAPLVVFLKIGAKNTVTIAELKIQAANALKHDASLIRLRKKLGGKGGKILCDGTTIKDAYTVLLETTDILVEYLPRPENVAEDDVVMLVQKFDPTKAVLEAPVEIFAKKTSTFLELKVRVASLSHIDVTNLRLLKVWSFQLKNASEIFKLEWDNETPTHSHIASFFRDSDLLVYRDVSVANHPDFASSSAGVTQTTATSGAAASTSAPYRPTEHALKIRAQTPLAPPAT